MADRRKFDCQPIGHMLWTVVGLVRKAAMISTDETTARGPAQIPEPLLARWLFGSSRAAWIWLIARLWLGWEWLRSGWSKVFGGNLTLRFWEWGDERYALTGDAFE